MNLKAFGKAVIAGMLTLVVMFNTACSTTGSDRVTSTPLPPGYEQLERGDTTAGQDFGTWVVQTGRGMIQDAYVRDNDKLGVVISRDVKPSEVRGLARALVNGFHNNFPDRDLTVLVYAPDKELILSARYNERTQQIYYDTAV
ncbi:MAG: hypothetical protein VKK04_10405 [Synechococcales bacterium]|nr:hypothetical protein [Synechococcales bacterium]